MRVLSESTSWRRVSPSLLVVTQKQPVRTSGANAMIFTGFSLVPLEFDPAIFVIAQASRLGLAFRHDLEPRRIGTEPREVIGGGLRAALRQRDVVLLGARRVGVTDD